VLTIREIAPYLLARKRIDAEDIVGGDLLIAEAKHRNWNYQVIRQRGSSYLLKQGIGPLGAALVAREARVYQYLQAGPAARRLRPYLPGYYEYDPQTGVLILELLRQAESLSALHRRRGRFPIRIATAIGEALGTLHRLPLPEPAAPEQPLPAQPPWVLSIHQPRLAMFREMSSANVRLIELIQNTPDVGQHLDALRQDWQRQSLVHHDLKGENMVVYARPGSRRRTRLALVDWESARIGDAGWDAGAIFSDYLSVWLLSIPITGEAPPERFLELARYPLEAIQPAIRSFWQAYARRMGFDRATAHQALLRAVRFGAARLVQTAYEQLQLARHLNGNVVGLLQLSLNMLQRPLEASVHLLGIPLQPARQA
jgi:aminoglycoside phosphotransferase (APT) family kinase protein